MLAPLPGPGRGTRAPAGGSAPGLTDEAAMLIVPDPSASAGPKDAMVRARARQIAARLALPRPRHDRSGRRGAGTLASLPYRGG